MFRATARLLDCRITLFTRNPCALCDTAKTVIRNVTSQRPLTYHEINVMEPGQEKWKSLYEFDTPVIHIDKADAPMTTASSLKLMHRFSEEHVLKMMDIAEK
ncbi:hypothetical protein ACEQ8H_005347 [Pleosporales sp. CAS-2024a]